MMTRVNSDIGRVESGASSSKLPSPRRSTKLDSKKRREILSQLFFKRKTLRSQLVQYLTLLVLSVVIAVGGLLTDSTAVVIAAMLVAPLMTPILGVAAAIVMGWPSRQLQQLLLVAVSVAIALAISVGLPWLFNVPRDLTLPEEVVARTQPGLGDLIVALSAGFVAAYVLARREALSALPGVAIAVALVPPLGACGILLYYGEPALAARAFLLFFTNFVTIVLTACAVFFVSGFRARDRAVRTQLRIALGMLLAAGLVVAAGGPLITHTVTQFKVIREQQVAIDVIQDWASPEDIEILNLVIKDDLIDVEFIFDVPFEAASTTNALIDLVPEGNTVSELQDMLVQRLEREITVTVQAQLRLMATAGDNLAGEE